MRKFGSRKSRSPLLILISESEKVSLFLLCWRLL